MTVQRAGWSGIKNGKLLALIAGSFDVFITIDRNMTYQQRMENLPFAVILIQVSSISLGSYAPHFEALRLAVANSSPGAVVTIG
ncbi:hypothetical protein DB346_10390 [Verrucomicrobia bacterium LW23]|nr:hypothetical protein DB346_10390 [Verrucomicrobia bacterium LW23]